MPTRLHTPAMCSVCEEAASKLRLMDEQAYGLLHGRCEAEVGSNVRARLCFRHSDGECLPPRPRTSDLLCLQRSSQQAPTYVASMRAASRCELEATQGSCSSLLPALEWKVLAAPITHLHDVLCLQRCCHQASTDGASLWAARQCEVEVDSRCLLAYIHQRCALSAKKQPASYD